MLTTFTRELLDLARSIEVIVHATRLEDHALADREAQRLPHRVAALDHALCLLSPNEHLEAWLLLAGLRERLAETAGIVNLAPARDLVRRLAA